MKKITSIILITIAISIGLIRSINAYADIKVEQKEIEVTKFVVTADVPENFKSDIEMNFINEDNGMNTYVLLDKKDNYKWESSIPLGNSHLQFLNIIGSKGYDYICNESITAYANQVANFKVQISSSSSFKGNKEDELNEKYNSGKENIQDKEDCDKKNTGVDNRKSITDKIETGMKKYIVTLIIIAILVIVYTANMIKVRRK